MPRKLLVEYAGETNQTLPMKSGSPTLAEKRAVLEKLFRADCFEFLKDHHP